MPLTQYTLRLADPVEDREAVLALWRQAFERPDQHPLKFEWCYAGTPARRGRLYLLGYETESQAIGVQGIVVRRWWLRGQAIDAGICADLVVDQQHRSIGPALTMVTGAVQREQQDYALKLLYAFPNRKTEALYRRKAYTQLTDITRYAIPLRRQIWLQRKGVPAALAAFAGGLIDLVAGLRQSVQRRHDNRSGMLVSVAEFDSRFDALWQRVSQTAGAMGIRDADFLQWRFGNNFVGQTQIMVLESAHGSIDGYVVYVVGEDRLVTILDFLASDNEQVLPVMLRQFIRVMQRRGQHGISLEYSGPAGVQHSLRRLGFSVRDKRPVYLIIGQDTLVPGDQGKLYLTSCDRDQ